MHHQHNSNHRSPHRSHCHHHVCDSKHSDHQKDIRADQLQHHHCRHNHTKSAKSKPKIGMEMSEVHRSPRKTRHQNMVRSHRRPELTEEIWIDGPMLDSNKMFSKRDHLVHEWIHNHDNIISSHGLQEEGQKSETVRSESAIPDFPPPLRLEEFLKQLVAVTSQSEPSSDSPSTNNCTNNVSLHTLSLTDKMEHEATCSPKHQEVGVSTDFIQEMDDKKKRSKFLHAFCCSR